MPKLVVPRSSWCDLIPNVESLSKGQIAIKVSCDEMRWDW